MSLFLTTKVHHAYFFIPTVLGVGSSPSFSGILWAQDTQRSDFT